MHSQEIRWVSNLTVCNIYSLYTRWLLSDSVKRGTKYKIIRSTFFIFETHYVDSEEPVDDSNTIEKGVTDVIEPHFGTIYNVVLISKFH